jgi:stearoyl-CoA desaturase (delta-9 desaturase)
VGFVAIILSFFIGHWLLSVFCQTFFLHRYGAHRMFTMSKGWERFFYLLTLVSQGSSFLQPRAYAILHREHHAYSDTEKDPHSPHHSKNVFDMMWKTAKLYGMLVRNERSPEPRFEGGYPRWEAIDRFGNTWTFRVACGVVYSLVYLAFAPHWAWFALLPVHFLMGPLHGSIVNYGGHKFGYRNFDSDDQSRNTLPFDFLTLGELFQNNHHRFGMAHKFSVRWFEVDATYGVIRLLAALGIVHVGKTQIPRYTPKTAAEPTPASAPLTDLVPVSRANLPSLDASLAGRQGPVRPGVGRSLHGAGTERPPFRCDRAVSPGRAGSLARAGATVQRGGLSR